MVYKILEELNRKTYNYKGVRTNIFGIPIFSSYNPKSLYAAAYRLMNKGMIDRDMDGWFMTVKGKKYFENKFDSLPQFIFKFGKNQPKNLIVMFDIPESRRTEREWLRSHLKRFDYEMIQKSVWLGPSPLPREFLKYLKKSGLTDNLKMFKTTKKNL